MEISITQPSGVSRQAGPFIHPEDNKDIAAWCRKWSVTPHQIQQAILHTGTLHAPSLKVYLMRDRWLYHPIEGTARFLKNTINYIF